MIFRRRKVVKTVPLIPTIVTLLNAFFGFLAIVKAYQGEFTESAWYIIFAVMADGFDGRIARALNAQTKFGKELDSLCDLVSFGVAPAFSLLAYLKSGSYDGLSGKVIFIFAFFYLAGVALRLARYNVETTESSTRFSGLPSPAAAGLIATTVVAISWCDKALATEIFQHALVIVLPYLYLLTGMLMMSRIRYPHLMNSLVGMRVKLRLFAVIVLAVMTLAVFKEFALFLAEVFYVALTPFIKPRAAAVSEPARPQPADPVKN